MIDLNPEMGTRAKQATDAVQAERLSPEAPQNGDAIVRSHGNANRETSAEMTDDSMVERRYNKSRNMLITKEMSPTTGSSALNMLIRKELR